MKIGREIKFRVWDKQTKKMSPPFVLFGEFTLLGAVHDWQHEMGHPAKTSLEALGDLEVMQYTGLKDKKGKEIYEGDILQVDERDTSIAQVIYDDAEFKLKNMYFKNAYWKLKYKNREQAAEVIGNIYKNPELFEPLTTN